MNLPHGPSEDEGRRANDGCAKGYGVMVRIKTMALLAAMTMMMAGCPQAPDKALSDAERALLAASARKSCASERYAAAEQLLEEAKTLVKANKFEEAERKARAAQKLAERAKKEADANWEDCNKTKAVVAEAKKPVEDKPPAEEPAELKTVFFAYDSSELTPDQRTILDENAIWMRQNPDAKLVLEGHTDERGSVEYNLALGERRARVVQQYLLQLGVEGARLRLLSYGEEKPAAFGQSVEDYRSNRRVEFVPSQKK